MESHFQLLRRRGNSWKHRGEEKAKTTENIRGSFEIVFNAQRSFASRSSSNHSTHGISSINDSSNRCDSLNQFGNGNLNQCGTSFSGSFAVAVGTCLYQQPERVSILTSKPVDINRIGSLSRPDSFPPVTKSCATQIATEIPNNLAAQPLTSSEAFNLVQQASNVSSLFMKLKHNFIVEDATNINTRTDCEYPDGHSNGADLMPKEHQR